MEYFTEHQDQLPRQDFMRYRAFRRSPYKKVLALAADLRGLTVIHVNSAFNSGGVAEILKSQVPLERSLSIDSRWLVLSGPPEFFNITKKIHDTLQGKRGDLSAKEKKLYLEHNQKASGRLLEYIAAQGTDVVVILHDPQPLAMIQYLTNVPVISRIHIDLSNANKKVLQFLKPFLLAADYTIFSDKKFRPRFINQKTSAISFPAIDAFAPKNETLSKKEIEEVLVKIGVDPKRPLLTQVSRFDPWKDPRGVIKAFTMVKKKFPDAQLALAGLIVAEDDPEAKGIYAELKQTYGDQKDIYLYGDKAPPGGIDNELFINALQTGSDAVIQKSLREGFGLTVTEAMFKRQPVIGGNVGGIKHQITHKKNGFLVSSPKECAKYMELLLSDKTLRDTLGKNARASVEKNFLMPNLMLDHVRIYKKLAKTGRVRNGNASRRKDKTAYFGRMPVNSLLKNN